MAPIAHRPAEANDRKTPGHWEGDLIIGKGGRSAIATLVERTTRFTVLVRLPAGRTAGSLHAALTTVLTSLPDGWARSLTWDTHNGGALPSGRVWPSLGPALVVLCGGSVGSLLAAGRASTGRADVT